MQNQNTTQAGERTQYGWAVQIQPRNGQELAELPDGIEGTFRDWNNRDRKFYPEAERQVWDGFKLVVNKQSREVFKVAN